MTLFLTSLAILIIGYFVYGLIVDRVVATDPKRPMPCDTRRDGVDFMPMPAWKAFLIQFLNIAGLGPIFGAIMGVMFGPAAFLWITFGTIFAGGVHDFLSGVVSIRSGGASLPEIVGNNLGINLKRVMTVFSCVLLILVGAVFISTPAAIIAALTPDYLDKWFWVVAIFIYYLLATLLPIDKLIGNLYPLFGLALLFMALGIMAVMIFDPSVTIPASFSDSFGTHSANPIFPMMFVSIACGALSGFHATQSPMMARCLTNERLARPIFYGAMVAEGIVALIWAAAAIAFTGGYEKLGEYFATHTGGAATIVNDISISWLGALGGVLAILGVVAAPITSGDTALRSTRLIIADTFHLKQSSIGSRLMITIPIFAVVTLLMFIDFDILWRYFAWANQSLAVFTLWAVTVYLARHRMAWIISFIPAIFMTVVCTSYLLCAPSPEGFGLPVSTAVAAGGVLAVILSIIFGRSLRRYSSVILAPESSL